MSGRGNNSNKEFLRMNLRSRYMEIIRYINGKRVEADDLPQYTLESDVIQRTIKTLNDRIIFFSKNNFAKTQ
jgi:hypothetical protein